jgi:hypothetical protein
MIKRADASKISREKATKEQIAENFKRLAIDTDKKVQLKPSLLKIQKTLDGNTFGIIHENKTYYLKYTNKKGSTNPTDFKHLDGLNATFGIEKFNSFEKATNKMTFICEAQNNAHKLRLLLEKDEDIIDDTEDTSSDSKETKSDEKPVTSDSTENDLLKNLKKAPAPEMGGEMPTDAAAPEMSDIPPSPEGGEEAPMDTQPKGESPKEMADEILPAIGDTDKTAPEGGDMGDAEEPAAPEGGDMGDTEEPAAPEGGDMGDAEEPAAPAPEDEKGDSKKEFQEVVGKLVQVTTKLRKDGDLKPEDIKNIMNSSIAAVGKEGFKEVGDNVVDSFIKKIRGSEEKIDTNKKEEPAEEAPAEEPSLDENFVRSLKTKAKVLLKEQLQEEILKRKRNLLIQNIKRKLI